MDIVTSQQQTSGSRRLFAIIFFFPSALGYLYIINNSIGIGYALILLLYLFLGWFIATKYGKKEKVLFCSIINGYLIFDKTSIFKRFNTKAIVSDITEIIISKNKYEPPMAHIYLKSGAHVATSLGGVDIGDFKSFIISNCSNVIFNNYVQSA